MAVNSFTLFEALREYEESPAKRPKIMNTPPAEVYGADENDSHPQRFVKMRADLVSGHEDVLEASWDRLLRQLQEEVKFVTQTGSEMISKIDFKDLSVPTKAEPFLRDLMFRGAAVIRNVIPEDEAAAWADDLDRYLRDNPHSKASPAENPELYELFWSLAQINSRAHPNMLAAQKFVMTGCWHQSSASQDEDASSNFPVTYADRVRMTHKSLRGSSSRLYEAILPVPPNAEEDDSDARWEAGSYGRHAATVKYRKIWSGNWENYDPWDLSTRLDGQNDSHNTLNTSSVLKMFQGMLPLSMGSSDDEPHMPLCPLPLKLATAYRLLRPLFSPKRPLRDDSEGFLDPSNWVLDMMQGSSNHTARSSPSHEINSILNPHLRLQKTLIPLPPLGPGDYVIWHPDTICATSSARPKVDTLLPSPLQTCRHPTARRTLPPSPSTLIYVPACPLTKNNAKYLARQRRAFLLGFPGPDFASTQGTGRAEIGESCHMGRPGVQEINEAGGEEALRAMGLLAWEEDDAADDDERSLLKKANAVLFPDRAMGR